ncbi:hypothetical protein [Clostridium folliculivorans]|nr:hypothetical protein [Clostridium folliculivorans]
MKKILSVIVILVLCSGAFLGCSSSSGGSGSGSNSSPEGCAKMFIGALIKADEKTLNSINKSDSLDYPTHFLLSDYAPDYSNYKLSDFTFTVDNSNKYVVVKSNDGKKNLKLEIIKANDKYYFYSMTSSSQASTPSKGTTSQNSTAPSQSTSASATSTGSVSSIKGKWVGLINQGGSEEIEIRLIINKIDSKGTITDGVLTLTLTATKQFETAKIAGTYKDDKLSIKATEWNFKSADSYDELSELNIDGTVDLKHNEIKGELDHHETIILKQ